MSFVSLSFFFFFPLVTLVYFLLPHRFRWIWLLLASCIFYMAFIPAYILILFALIAIDFTMAILIENNAGRERRHFLWISVASLVGVLFVYKYFNFFNANITLLAQFLRWKYPIGLLALALPIGLSFHTFQSLSYVIEVYRGKQKAERHLGVYALYVMFYPQLVAGPIERPQHLLHQFYETQVFDYDRIRLGLIRMAWGFFKKMIVADRLAIVVNHVYQTPGSYDGLPLMAAVIFFTLELYFDFSAYCDIALGAAQVMGFTLVENFNRPFAAKTMAEFWRRWHISLSSWFRDYFYYPLTATHKRITRTSIYASLLLTFLVTGFWHGADWTYGIFGFLHGFYIVFGSIVQKIRTQAAQFFRLNHVPRIHRALVGCSIFFLMAFSCIFFRAPNFQEAWYIVTHLFNGFSHIADSKYIVGELGSMGMSLKALGLVIVLSALVFWAEHYREGKGPYALIAERPWYIRWPIYWLLIISIVMLNESGTSQFIYFQF
jgi:alginate O-acetyltransferase complex protein AlgI